MVKLDMTFFNMIITHAEPTISITAIIVYVTKKYSMFIPSSGIESLRCARSGRDLPSARAVSARVHGPDETQDSPIFTLMHMSFGQFLAHDNERTAVTKLSKNDDGTQSTKFKEEACKITY